MLKPSLIVSTVAIALLCTACGQKDQAQKSSETESQAADADQTTAVAPSPAETTTAEVANEAEQAAGVQAQITPAELAAGSRVGDVANPQATLATAAVKSSMGEAVGEVRSVTMASNGKATAVNVEVAGFLNVGERVVAIGADRLTYLKDRKILVVALSKAEIEKMPAVAQN